MNAPLRALSKADIERFATDGHVVVPEVLDPTLLQRLRAFAEAQENAALALAARGEHPEDICVVQSDGWPHVTRVNAMLPRDAELTLDLLASPGLMAIARDLCGPGPVPVAVDIIVKQPHPSPAVLWHQDTQHSRAHPYLNVGVYLDDADPGDGCLRVVPGTQHRALDFADLVKQHGWALPGAVEVPVRAGDAVVHDIMVLHGSEPKRTTGPRRTVYVEYRPLDGLTEPGAHSARFADLRARWWALVLERAGPDAWPSAWGGRRDDLGPVPSEVAAILAHREPAVPAHYCPMPILRDDYPVPADLR